MQKTALKIRGENIVPVLKKYFTFNSFRSLPNLISKKTQFLQNIRSYAILNTIPVKLPEQLSIPNKIVQRRVEPLPVLFKNVEPLKSFHADPKYLLANIFISVFVQVAALYIWRASINATNRMLLNDTQSSEEETKNSEKSQNIEKKRISRRSVLKT